MADPTGDPLGVLGRMTQVLSAFDHDDHGISLSELSRRSALPKSTVSRVVSVLVDHGYLEREGRLLHLGLRVFELGQLARDPREVRAAALPVLMELREKTGESVHLALRDGEDMICIAVLHGRTDVPAELRMGARMPTASHPVGDITLAQHPAAAGAGRTTIQLTSARCGFGEGRDDIAGEIGVSVLTAGFDLRRIAPPLRAATADLARRFRTRPSTAPRTPLT